MAIRQHPAMPSGKPWCRALQACTYAACMQQEAALLSHTSHHTSSTSATLPESKQRVVREPHGRRPFGCCGRQR